MRAEAAVTAPLTDPGVEREIRNLRVELLHHLRAYRNAKSLFADITTGYELKYGPDGEFKARSDYRRVKAAADADWEWKEAVVAGVSLIALLLSGERAA